MRRKLLPPITSAEQRATLTGINLFFGALLGANLGTIGALPLVRYAILVAVLGGAAINILIIATSRSWWKIIGAACANAVAFIAILLNTKYHPPGSEDQVQRIAVTMAVWLAFLLVARLSPLAAEADTQRNPKGF